MAAARSGLAPHLAVVLRNLADELAPRRGWAFAAAGDAAAGAAAAERAGYLVLRGTGPARGQRADVVALVLAPESKCARFGPDLRAARRAALGAAAGPGLSDFILVAEDDEFYRKGNLAEVLDEYLAPRARGGDPAGESFYYAGLSYRHLTIVVPDHVAAVPHRPLPPDEEAAVLAELRAAPSHLPEIEATDPMVVWTGARPGQVVEILRRGGAEIYYRRVKAPRR